MSRLRHLSSDTLTDLADERLTDDARDAALAHVAGCTRCADELAWLRATLTALRADEGEDAPGWAVRHALGLFRSALSPAPAREPGLFQRIAAALSFDSGLAPATPGLRSGALGARQLLYAAGEHDLDLRVIPSGSGWQIAGQLLGPELAGGHAILSASDGRTREQPLRAGELRFEGVDPGTYTLLVRGASAEIVVERLQVGMADG